MTQEPVYSFAPGGRALVMGILNVTPDSFSDGGSYFQPQRALEHALEMQEQGADIIDVGAQSTRPGHTEISAQEECERLLPVLELLRGKIHVPLSIDTFYPQAAEVALQNGAAIINDVKGFADEGMYRLAREYRCGCVIMHPGELAEPALPAMKSFFEERLQKAREYRLSESQLCFDPGIGFGKSNEQNLRLLSGVAEYRAAGCAVLIGASRKRVIGACCGNPPFQERLAGTLAAHSIAVFAGADVVRVHDVAAAVQAAKVAQAVRRGTIG